MKRLSTLLLLVILFACTASSTKSAPSGWQKEIVGTTEYCVYGYWRNGASAFAFCECVGTSANCSVSR